MSDEACNARAGCISCGDEGIPMRVLEVRVQDAVCLDDDGVRHEAVAVELVGDVAAGDRLLVHAGVAIGAL